jgi:hypothetical protein
MHPHLQPPPTKKLLRVLAIGAVHDHDQKLRLEWGQLGGKFGEGCRLLQGVYRGLLAALVEAVEEEWI